MKSCIFLLLACLLTSVAHASPDKELTRLEAVLAAADTQTDMNLRSYDIAQYLDRKIALLEEQIKTDADTDGEALRLFVEASQKWRDYRLAQVKSEGDVYRGGSIQPLVHNLVFIRITKERLAALKKWNPEGKYRED